VTEYSRQRDNDNIAADELSLLNGANVEGQRIKAQRVKIGFGGDGDFQDVGSGTPLPVKSASPTGAAELTDAGTITIPEGATVLSLLVLGESLSTTISGFESAGVEVSIGPLSGIIDWSDLDWVAGAEAEIVSAGGVDLVQALYRT